MRNILLVFVCLSSSLLGIAQSSFVSSGGEGTASTGSFSGSLGQIATSYEKASVGDVSQGVQVAYEVVTVGIDAYPFISLQMDVYPNPTITGVSLSITDLQQIGTCSAKLYNAEGKMLQRIEVSEPQTYIQMQNYVSGVYYLNVFKKNTMLKNFKIIKR